MSFRYRWLVVTALIGVVAAPGAEAQGGTLRVKRPLYGYFKYRIPRGNTLLAPRIRLGEEIRLRALERSMERIDRARERQFELQQRAWRRQFEVRERALSRMSERMVRLPKLRPYGFRGRSQTI